MSDNQILLAALDTRWKQLRKEWDRARLKYSKDSVHDLRVACRRLLAVLETLKSIADHSSIRDCRSEVKKFLDALSPLRDIQVLRTSVSGMMDQHPELAGFDKSLANEEDRIAKKVKKLLKHSPGLGHAINQARRHAKDRTQNAAILKVIDNRYRKVVKLAAMLDAAESETIHRMRLAFKKFRYTCEIAKPIIKKWVDEKQLETFHAFQTMMGDVQDNEVFSAKLSKWAEKKDREEDVQSVFDELKLDRQKKIATFMASAGQVRSFWRAGSAK